jgi:hypothetical protein
MGSTPQKKSAASEYCVSAVTDEERTSDEEEEEEEDDEATSSLSPCSFCTGETERPRFTRNRLLHKEKLANE